MHDWATAESCSAPRMDFESREHLVFAKMILNTRWLLAIYTKRVLVAEHSLLSEMHTEVAGFPWAEWTEFQLQVELTETGIKRMDWMLWFGSCIRLPECLYLIFLLVGKYFLRSGQNSHRKHSQTHSLIDFTFYIFSCTFENIKYMVGHRLEKIGTWWGKSAEAD